MDSGEDGHWDGSAKKSGAKDNEDGDDREAKDENVEEEEEEEDESFSVRDLLVWSADVQRNRQEKEVKQVRPAMRSFEFNSVILFYVGCLFAMLAAAEITMKAQLEAMGVPIIEVMQKGGESYQIFFDFIGFPPNVWAVAPGIVLSALPNSWRGVAVRMIFLQGVGKVIKWMENVCFRQGRPFWVSKKVHMWHCPTTYGFPSGHAMFLLLCIAPIIEHLWKNPKRIRVFKRNLSSPESGGETSKPGGGDHFGAFFISSTLMVLYAGNFIGRMYLGTHFLHSLLMGAVSATVLLQIFTSTNVAIIADRVIVSTRTNPHEPTHRRIIGILLRCTGITFFLLVTVHFVYLFSQEILEVDPLIWTERAMKGCGVPPDTRDGSRKTAYEGIGMIVGWVAALSLLAVRASSKSPRKLRTISSHQKRQIPHVPSYGTIVEKRERKNRNINDEESARYKWGMDWCLVLFSLLVQGVVSLSIMLSFNSPLLSHSLGVFVALFIFPTFLEPVLVASNASAEEPNSLSNTRNEV